MSVLEYVGGVGFSALVAPAAFVVAVACAVCFLLHDAHRGLSVGVVTLGWVLILL